MKYLFYILLVLIAFCMMEVVAWFTHKYVMHGFLWKLHKDHHQAHTRVFERNDSFFLLFAIPSLLLLLTGALANFDFKYWLGLGIALYGLTYFIIHDLWIHQRIKGIRQIKFTYLEAVKEAHQAHHQPHHRQQDQCFGLLIFPWHYYHQVKKRLKP
jgi:beta-carotene 3-hydroxylase